MWCCCRCLSAWCMRRFALQQAIIAHHPQVVGAGRRLCQHRTAHAGRAARVFDHRTTSRRRRRAPAAGAARTCAANAAASGCGGTFVRNDAGAVQYINMVEADIALPRWHPHLGRPCRIKYPSLLDMLNPMHRPGGWRWNKLTGGAGPLLEGSAVARREPGLHQPLMAPAPKRWPDRIEAIVREGPQTGFHFSDDAAPPSAQDPGHRAYDCATQASAGRAMCGPSKTSPRAGRADGRLAACHYPRLEVASDRLLQLTVRVRWTWRA